MTRRTRTFVGAIVLLGIAIPTHWTKKTVLEAFPDGVWLARAAPDSYPFVFERDGRELVRISISNEAAKLGNYALKVCGPDKYGGRRIVVRIAPYGDRGDVNTVPRNVDLCTGEERLPASKQQASAP